MTDCIGQMDKFICTNCMRILEQQPFEDWPPKLCKCDSDEFMLLSEFRNNEQANARDEELEDRRTFGKET